MISRNWHSHLSFSVRFQNSFTFSILYFLSSMFISGCVKTLTETEYVFTKSLELEKSGISHQVKPGETLWRIARTYDIPISDIIKTNNISNAGQIEKGQVLFIPGASADKEVILDDETTKDEFIWPLEGRILNYFHARLAAGLNKGIHIQSAPGKFVLAARTGRVVFADYLAGYGYTVVLDHMDGYHTIYAQNAKLLVKVGDLVIKKSPIAQSGKRPNNQMAYLYFEIRKNTVEDNPLYYLP